ncbi:MAG: stage 0 sporulation family protein [Defluviitaleaceae bacterium]|nr:stage 0 sporulation family protein [Defluviitaleaceae bacterium]MCL2262196.1 stage 0 sporulation family protein [Defluviitaleaceae bacterium]
MIIIGVRFKDVGKVYYFDPHKFSSEELPLGAAVIVETGRGAEYGIVALEKRDADVRSLPQPIRKVLRLATEQDTEQEIKNRQREQDAQETCQEKIKEHGLDMHLVDVELTFDLSKIIFYFTADGRVDFRELVKDLAATFRMRIELRQIGVRDEAKMLNGIGICGRALCCATFLDEFQPVSIKSAKDQGLSLNPTKISGVCGKLMCCLKYEEETYAELMKGMPGVGDLVRTPAGDGDVLSINILRQTARVSVRVKNGEDPVTDIYPAADIKVLEHRPQCERGCNCPKCKK